MIGYTFLIYGDGGTGKSYLAASAPGRKLFLDIEDRADNLPGEVVRWDGKGEFPKCGADATVVLSCKSAEALTKIVGAIKSGKLPIQSVIVDSITMLQQNEIDEKFAGQMQKQHWGQLLKLIAPPLKQLMTLTKSNSSPIECVVLTAWHKEYTIAEELRIKPFVDGQLQQRLSHLTDVVGYLTVQRRGTEKTRKLQIEPTGGVTAKSTYSSLDKYNGVVVQPSIVTLIADMKNTKENSNV